MNVKERNQEVKKLLSKEFGRENVSVLNGRGTAWGWCNVRINAGKRLDPQAEFYSQRERDLINSINKKAHELIKGIDFYEYTDDMGGENKEVLIQVSLQ